MLYWVHDAQGNLGMASELLQKYFTFPDHDDSCLCRRLFHLHGHPWVVLRHEPYPWCPLWRVFQGEYPHHHHHQCCNLNMFAVRYFPTSPPPGEGEIAVSWRFPKDARKTTNGRGLARISGLSNLNMDMDNRNS